MPYLIVFGVFAVFIIFLFTLDQFQIKNKVTGNAVLSTSQLNPNYLFIVFILVSFYAVLVISYVEYGKKDVKKAKRPSKRRKKR